MVKAQENKKKQGESWADVLAGNRLAVYTLIAIVIACLFGVFLPQRGPGLSEAQYQDLLNAEGAWGIAAKIGLLDVFHSLWFYGLILLLLINLTVCSIKRYQNFAKFDRTFPTEPGPELLNRMPYKLEFSATAIDDATVASVLSIKKKVGTSHSAYYYSETGRMGRYGVFAIHGAVLLLAIGVMIGNLFGIDGTINIPEGESYSTILLRKGGAYDLPFQVRCDKFTVEFYDSGQPKLFRSVLTFIPPYGNPVKADIEVNKPVAFGGYRFFQASYGQIPEKLTMRITRRADNKIFEPLSVFAQQSYKTPDGEAQFGVMQTDPDKANAGPAAMVVEEIPGSDETSFWIFKTHPEFDQSRNGKYFYELMDIGPGGYYTGIMVAADPGVWVVWTAFAVGFLGLILAFFVPHRRYVVRISGDQITLGGFSNRRGLESLEDRMLAIQEHLKAKEN